MGTYHIFFRKRFARRRGMKSCLILLRMQDVLMCFRIQCVQNSKYTVGETFRLSSPFNERDKQQILILCGVNSLRTVQQE